MKNVFSNKHMRVLAEGILAGLLIHLFFGLYEWLGDSRFFYNNLAFIPKTLLFYLNSINLVLCAFLDPQIVLVGLGNVYNAVGLRHPDELFWLLLQTTPVTVFAYILAAWFRVLAIERSRWFWLAVCLSPICGELLIGYLIAVFHLDTFFMHYYL